MLWFPFVSAVYVIVIDIYWFVKGRGNFGLTIVIEMGGKVLHVLGVSFGVGRKVG
jgi:hypothetical protein